MRIPVIAGNWKMYKKTSEAVTLVADLATRVATVRDVEVIVAPVFTVLSSVKTTLSGTSIKLAGQNCFWETEGAFTGEISAEMLVDAGCSHVILGHSERRQFFGETDESVNKKIKAALRSRLIAILCIGETLAQRDADQTTDILKTQITGALAGIGKEELQNMIIAYEPVWAIGTGKTATDEQAQDAHTFIRGLVAGLYDQEAADGIRILYGGSVKPDNVKGLMSQPDIDGALVGGASLKADSFAAIVNFND